MDVAPVWLKMRRLSPEHVHELLRDLLGLVSWYLHAKTDVELYIKDKRTPIKSLSWEQLSSLLASEWPSVESDKPLWDTKLGITRNSLARVRIFTDTQQAGVAVRVSWLSPR